MICINYVWSDVIKRIHHLYRKVPELTHLLNIFMHNYEDIVHIDIVPGTISSFLTYCPHISKNGRATLMR